MRLTYCKVISCRKRFTAPILTPNLLDRLKQLAIAGGEVVLGIVQQD